jgi:hypothetical protein
MREVAVVFWLPATLVMVIGAVLILVSGMLRIAGRTVAGVGVHLLGAVFGAAAAAILTIGIEHAHATDRVTLTVGLAYYVVAAAMIGVVVRTLVRELAP